MCSILGLKQPIKHPTRIKPRHTSTFIEHIITNCEEKVTQSGVIHLVLSTFPHLTISLLFELGKSRE